MSIDGQEIPQDVRIPSKIFTGGTEVLTGEAQLRQKQERIKAAETVEQQYARERRGNPYASTWRSS